MLGENLELRRGTADDAAFLAHIVNIVSEGVTEALLGNALPGLSAEKALEMVFRRGEAPYAPENVLLVEEEGRVLGLLFSYDAVLQKVPAVMTGFLGEKRVGPFRPLLEASVSDALWVNTLWVSEEARGLGLGTLLLNLAEDTALEQGKTAVALHCFADNAGGMRLYEKFGFVRQGEIPSAPVLSDRHPQGGVLWVKRLSESAA